MSNALSAVDYAFKTAFWHDNEEKQKEAAREAAEKHQRDLLYMGGDHTEEQEAAAVNPTWKDKVRDFWIQKRIEAAKEAVKEIQLAEWRQKVNPESEWKQDISDRITHISNINKEKFNGDKNLELAYEDLSEPDEEKNDYATNLTPSISDINSFVMSDAQEDEAERIRLYFLTSLTDEQRQRMHGGENIENILAELPEERQIELATQILDLINSMPNDSLHQLQFMTNGAFEMLPVETQYMIYRYISENRSFDGDSMLALGMTLDRKKSKANKQAEYIMDVYNRNSMAETAWNYDMDKVNANVLTHLLTSPMGNSIKAMLDYDEGKENRLKLSTPEESFVRNYGFLVSNEEALEKLIEIGNMIPEDEEQEQRIRAGKAYDYSDMEGSKEYIDILNSSSVLLDELSPEEKNSVMFLTSEILYGIPGGKRLVIADYMNRSGGKIDIQTLAEIGVYSPSNAWIEGDEDFVALLEKEYQNCMNGTTFKDLDDAARAERMAQATSYIVGNIQDKLLGGNVVIKDFVGWDNYLKSEIKKLVIEGTIDTLSGMNSEKMDELFKRSFELE